ncbi:MAG: Coenzyme F420 hydrogenase/dehydrogenase, beta subunit C-terminal domain [Ruminococcus sp.]|nr:Coenzyme F420 hydrogenase/dehydrogenase, beta subunit C-terminal domain [Ruminococcus sp.]
MEVCSQKRCTVCGACISACPQNCISLKTNEYGFDYPIINNNLCIKCGKCRSVCHIINGVKKEYPRKAFAVWSNNPDDRKTSASGGAASVFYQKVLSEGGYCFGAAYDKDLNVVIKGYNSQRVTEFKQSKYVHSYMNDSYNEIKALLNDNQKVIFIGLPCQIAALKSFLHKEYDNLLLVDLVCHGTPPISYLNEHIQYISNITKSKIDSVQFREDNVFCFSAYSDYEKKYSAHSSIDTYLLSFINCLTYYDSCYECEYACNERSSDITIGDFWGLGLEIPFDHPYTGAISLVLTNSTKGDLFFDSVKKDLFCEERTVAEALKGNAQLNSPSERNSDRDSFLSLYLNQGFEHATYEIYKRLIKKNKIILFKNNIKNKLRITAKKILRK